MNTQELHELAKKIAPLIGYEYRIEANRGGIHDGLHWLAHIQRPQAGYGELYIENSRQKGRVSINVSYPRSGAEMGFKVYTVSSYQLKDRTTGITVAETKSPEQIAKDIKSRLLADAESVYSEAYQSMIRDIAWKNERVAAIRKVGALLGQQVEKQNGEMRGSFYFNNVNGQVEVRSATDIKITYSANAKNIEKILAFFKTLEAKDGEKEKA